VPRPVPGFPSNATFASVSDGGEFLQGAVQAFTLTPVVSSCKLVASFVTD
jgi:hypothetical protein